MKKIILSTAASLIIGLGLIGGAIWWTGRPTEVVDANKVFTKSELAVYDGLHNHDCYVAVDGTVYLIKGFAQWEMGRHIPSEGQAKCGQDLSEVIKKSPHGRRVLKLLIIVGKYRG